MIIEGKTAEGLVTHAEKALKEGWWYVWGTFGNLLTEAKLKEKVDQYPQRNSYKKHSAHIGQIVSDCVGLIKSYMWWDDTQNKPVYDVTQDVDTGTMYNLATRKGPISSIPEEPGLCTYMSGHVGVYIGNGWVIECTGGRGVVKTPLKGKGSTSWTSWFACPYIAYASDAKPGPEPGPEEAQPYPCTVQAQSFDSLEEAQHLEKELSDRGYYTMVRHSVCVGKFKNAEEAQKTADDLIKKGYGGFVTKLC